MNRTHLHDCQPGDTYYGRECIHRTRTFPPYASFNGVNTKILNHYFKDGLIISTKPCVSLTQIPAASDDDDLIRIPCEWICPDCGMMETDELARDEHTCPEDQLNLTLQ